MTDTDRMKALRRDISPEQAMNARKGMNRKRSGYWLNNALAFNWHSEPDWRALSSFRYAQRLAK